MLSSQSINTSLASFHSVTMDSAEWNITAVSLNPVSDNGGSLMDDLQSTLATELSQSVVYDAFIHTNPYMAWPYVAAVAGALCLGVWGNILIIAATILYRPLKITGYQLVINLAVADLVVVGIADPLCILGATMGKTFFDANPWLCEVIACLCLSACFCAFLSLGCLTLSRFVCVHYPSIYRKVFSNMTMTVMCVLVWVAAFAFEMPNFFGWGDHYFDQKNMQCIWDRRASFSYTLFVSCVLVGCPLLLMAMAYISIFTKVLRSKLNMAAHMADPKGGDESTLKAWKETIRSCRTLFIVVIAFFVCWTPYVVVICVDMADRLPGWVHLWSTYLAHLHSTLTFFIYGFSNPNYREGYRQVLSLCNPAMLESRSGGESMEKAAPRSSTVPSTTTTGTSGTSGTSGTTDLTKSVEGGGAGEPAISNIAKSGAENGVATAVAVG